MSLARSADRQQGHEDRFPWLSQCKRPSLAQRACAGSAMAAPKVVHEYEALSFHKTGEGLSSEESRARRARASTSALWLRRFFG